jgi:hypothetical protein
VTGVVVTANVQSLRVTYHIERPLLLPSSAPPSSLLPPALGGKEEEKEREEEEGVRFSGKKLEFPSDIPLGESSSLTLVLHNNTAISTMYSLAFLRYGKRRGSEDYFFYFFFFFLFIFICLLKKFFYFFIFFFFFYFMLIPIVR